MKDESRGREKKEAWRGRRRTYKCRNCGEKFRVDTLEPLAEKQRICLICRVEGGHYVNPYSPVKGIAVDG